jgi:hypothetical protein
VPPSNEYLVSPLDIDSVIFLESALLASYDPFIYKKVHDSIKKKAMELAIGAPAFKKYIKRCYLKISNMYYSCMYILSWYLSVQLFQKNMLSGLHENDNIQMPLQLIV